jgi:DNA-binding CsgD family transcriptional regulator
MEATASSQISVWHMCTPELVSLIGQPTFAAQLARALDDLVSFDIDCTFAYPGQNKPLLLHDGLRGVSAAPIMANYINGTYLLDAVYSACRRLTPPGLYRLSDLAPDAFFEGEYYNSPDVHPCISMETGALAEEIVFLVPGSGTVYLAYSLMRQNASLPFSDAEMARLQQVAPMVTALIASHWRNVGGGDTEPVATHDRQEVMELAFRTFLPSRLTSREQTIVSLVLRGHSSLSIGNHLHITEGTVKIHRKNIYSKLGISSQTELFNLFLKHVLP